MTHWARLPERGTRLGLRLIAFGYRLLGERVLHLALYPVVGYFLLTAGAARRASMDYLARLRTFSGDRTPRPGWRASFRHMMAFAESGLHKLGAWTGRLDQPVQFPDRGTLDELLSGGKGALLLGAHFGNLEMTRAIAAHHRLAKVTAVVYSEHATAFRGMLETASEEYAANLVHVTEITPATVIALKEKVERGELLVIVGDRTPAAHNGRVCSVDFLGAPAEFAEGPFILAHLLECPVYLFFCPREPSGYRIYLEPFAERIDLPRAQRAQALRSHVRRYAARLESLCANTPYQWFNFYNYWQPR
jgi:predicted LPLAT superfamily acyltransferase